MLLSEESVREDLCAPVLERIRWMPMGEGAPNERIKAEAETALYRLLASLYNIGHWVHDANDRPIEYFYEVKITCTINTADKSVEVVIGRRAANDR